jgi:hypothetical protein
MESALSATVARDSLEKRGVMVLEQAKVPTAIRRRAMQHMESIRGTPMAPHADNARLANEIWPIYRPDLDEIAYYEFAIELAFNVQRLATWAAGPAGLIAAKRQPTGTRARRATSTISRIGPPQPATGLGFIIVASGPHDFPIPHWSLDRPPPSAQLAAAARQGGGAIDRITKIDSLAYVAEAKDGSLVAQVGQMPALLAGLPHDLGRYRGAISSLKAAPSRNLPSDDNSEGVEHTAEREGKSPPNLKPIDAEGGWPAFRERYSDSFGPFLDDLRRQAAGAWEIEALIEQFGEGIKVGDSHRIALLQPAAIVDLSGDGAAFVKAHIEENTGAPALVIEVHEGANVEHEIDLDVNLRYPDGVEERLRYFLVSAQTPSNRRTSLSEGGQ